MSTTRQKLIQTRVNYDISLNEGNTTATAELIFITGTPFYQLENDGSTGKQGIVKKINVNTKRLFVELEELTELIGTLMLVQASLTAIQSHADRIQLKPKEVPPPDASAATV